MSRNVREMSICLKSFNRENVTLYAIQSIQGHKPKRILMKETLLFFPHGVYSNHQGKRRQTNASLSSFYFFEKKKKEKKRSKNEKHCFCHETFASAYLFDKPKELNPAKNPSPGKSYRDGWFPYKYKIGPWGEKIIGYLLAESRPTRLHTSKQLSTLISDIKLLLLFLSRSPSRPQTLSRKSKIFNPSNLPPMPPFPLFLPHTWHPI